MEEFEFRQELERAIFEAGITGLFSREKLAEKVKEHFERIGKLKELKEHLKEKEKSPAYHLMEPVYVGKNPDGSLGEVLFYSLLENEGIYWDPQGFLRLNGERIALVGEGIIPLKGKKKELKKALGKIIELGEIFELPSYADQESENPFVQTLSHLDELPEYDPEEEERERQFEKEFRQGNIKLRLLEEVPHIRTYREKRFGIIPRIRVKFNPGYEEFFHNHLSQYSIEEIYSALRNLEKEAEGNLKHKIKVLRKEFEKREGISRRRNYALLALGILGSAAILGAFNYVYIPQEKRNQRIEQLKGTGLTEEQAISFDSLYSKFAEDTWLTSKYNQTVLDFAKHYGKNPDLAKEVFKIYLNFKNSNEFLPFALDKPNSLDFVRKYSDLVRSFNFRYPLELHSKNSTVFEELYRNISLDPRITLDRNKLTDSASQLFLDLGYTGKVKVLIPGTDNYKEEFLAKPTINFVGNYSIALYQLNYPRHSKEAIWKAGNATQIDADIMDFNPYDVTGVDGKSIYLMPNNNIPTVVYGLANHFYYTDIVNNQNVVKHVKDLARALNIKVRWEDFIWYDVLKQNPLDKEIWENPEWGRIANWNYHWLSTPQAGNVSGRVTLLPWYNSSLMDELYPNRVDQVQRIKEMWIPTIFLFYDFNRGMKLWQENPPPMIEMLKSNNNITALNEWYDWINRIYNNPDSQEHRDVRDRFTYKYFVDRANWGWNNTAQQFKKLIEGLSERIEPSDIPYYKRYYLKDKTLDLLTFTDAFMYEARVRDWYNAKTWRREDFAISAIMLGAKVLGTSVDIIDSEPYDYVNRIWAPAYPFPKPLREYVENNPEILGHYTFSIGSGLGFLSGIEGKIADGAKYLIQSDMIPVEPYGILLWKKKD